MPRLVGKGEKRHGKRSGNARRRTLARKEAGHIRARHVARVRAVCHGIYFSFNPEFFATACEEEEIASNDFAKSLFLGACEHIEEIDAKINENLRSWSLSRVSRVSLAVMRICAYELMFTDIPVSIAINEALEVDKKFDKDDAPSFINGVLNAIAKGCVRE